MSAAPQMLKVLKLSIEVVRGPNQGEAFTFEKTLVKIGRGPENDIVFGADVKVSREHIELQVTPDRVVVKNLSQKNPIAVDGEETTHTVLRPGSSIRFGETELKINFDKVAESKAVVSFPLQPNSPPPPPKNAPVKLESLQVVSAAAPDFPPAPSPSHEIAPVASQNVSPPRPQNVAPWGNQTAATWAPPPPSRPSAQPAREAYPPPPNYQTPKASGSKMPFYLIVGGVILVAAYLVTQDQIKKKTQLRLKDSVATEISINDSQTEYDKTLKEIEKKGQDTIQYKTAQEQYLRGFRDYRQGQFVRAMEEFQAALSFYPNHELSRKYYTLAKRKFDEQVQFNMIQAKRYYGVSNYRLCMGYYSTVIKMKKDERDPVRREALQYYNECELKMRGKY